MASDNTLCIFVPQDNEPPDANFATLDLRNGHPVLDFDAGSAETAIFTGVLPRHYAGGGLTATLIWAASSAESGDVQWDADIERLEAAGTDLDANSFAAEQQITAAAPTTSGTLKYSTIAFTNGAQMDNLVAGEAFRFRLSREAASGLDTMTGDAELVAIEIKET